MFGIGIVHKLKVHTNIALDYPTCISGYIYTSKNIEKLFSNDKFKAKLKNRTIYGSFGNVSLEIPADQISHVVTNAIITNDREIIFEIETLDNVAGNYLAEESNKFNLLAKVVARLSSVIVGGKLTVHDIRYVHIIKLGDK